MPADRLVSGTERTTMVLDIMMPFYGRVDHFRIAVVSVLAQTDPDWRLVVIDDAYPDESAGEWLTGLRDERIRYVRNPTNIGINRNFQAAIDLADADRLVVFGCDDVLLPGYVERIRMLATMNPDAAIIHPGTVVIDAEGSPRRTLVDTMKSVYRPRAKGVLRLGGEELAVSITRGNWMNFPAIAWRRDLVRASGFRTGFEVVQDLALALDVLFLGGEMVLDDEVVFAYRRHQESVSSWQAASGRRFVEEARFFGSLAEEFADRGWTRARRAAAVHLSSRINALTHLPRAMAARDDASSRILLKHAFGPLGADQSTS